MLNPSNTNNSFNQETIILPKVQGLNPGIEYQIFQYNLQGYLNSVRMNSYAPALKPEERQNIEKCNEKPSNLSIDLSNLYNTKQFELTLNTKFQNPLCKCKYFSLKVYLRPLQQFVLPPQEKVQLEVFIYSEDGRLITKNMKGKDILRGNYVQNLSYFAMESVHIAYFRIQITEVSSHYVGKTVKIEIRPKQTEFLQKMGWRIKKFSKKNVVIKAKDLKN